MELLSLLIVTFSFLEFFLETYFKPWGAAEEPPSLSRNALFAPQIGISVVYQNK